MGVIKAIVNGMGTTLRKPRPILILYSVNLVFAAAVALPLLVLIQQDLGHSFAGSAVRPLDIMWLGEAVLDLGAALPALAAGWAFAGLLYLALQVFLNGGLYGRLLDREGPTRLAAFAGDSGRYFWRFVRLSLIGLVFAALTLVLIMGLVSALFKPLDEGAVTEWLPLILSNLHFLVALALMSAVRMVLDYARIAVVADEERRILRALRHALTFLRRRFFTAWAIYLLIVVLTAAGSVAFYVVFGRLGKPGVVPLLLGLAWMQVYVIFRIWIRALFVTAQGEFYRSRPY
jgi:hypothetical protein